MTFFDIITVGFFAGLVAAFFIWTDHDRQTLINFVLVGAVFGVANQAGNAGYAILAFVLMAAGASYAVIVTRK
jgi:uncharacterized membrane protein